MTPNGALAFTALTIASAFAARGVVALAILLAMLTAFAAVETGRAAAAALSRALILVLPLAAFLALVWIIVGRAPDEIAAGLDGSREAAARHAGIVTTRLFAIVLAVQLAVARFASWTPFRFVAALSAPLPAKRVLVLVLSFVETFRQAIGRAHVALVAAGVATPGVSLRNVAQGWVLIQTVWLSTVTIALGRLKTKWPIEGTVTLLDGALTTQPSPKLMRRDTIWIALAAATMVASFWVRV